MFFFDLLVSVTTLNLKSSRSVWIREPPRRPSQPAPGNIPGFDAWDQPRRGGVEAGLAAAANLSRTRAAGRLRRRQSAGIRFQGWSCASCSCLLPINLWGSCCPPGTRAAASPLSLQQTHGRRRLGSRVATGFGPGGIKAPCWAPPFCSFFTGPEERRERRWTTMRSQTSVGGKAPRLLARKLPRSPKLSKTCD